MSISNDLSQLHELHRQGALSDAEFAQAKAKLLSAVEPHGAGEAPFVSAINRLRRSPSERWIGGVCGGLAQLSGLAAWVWRVGFLLLLLCGGTGLVLYILLWVFVPEAKPHEQGGNRASAGAAP
jgi:phage shock protein PspC (stress-responsive transcriptional regulator)